MGFLGVVTIGTVMYQKLFKYFAVNRNCFGGLRLNWRGDEIQASSKNKEMRIHIFILINGTCLLQGSFSGGECQMQAINRNLLQ